MHNLLKYKDIERANNKNWGLFGSPSELKACRLAWEVLTRVSNMEKEGPLIVIMTATVNALSVALDRRKVNVVMQRYPPTPL
jgi:hypothetical protein